MPDLPRLLYVGDVPVEASYHGSALMYRLLEAYPADRLAIVEAGDLVSDAPRRLSSIRYHRPRTASSRLSGFGSTRFSKAAAALQILMAQHFFAPVRAIAAEFAPEAILTVVHGYSWVSAHALSGSLGVPLHLVIHDDPPNSIAVPAAFRPLLERKFEQAYRGAASRFCVSPAMAEEYERHYGVKGSVLYPSQGPASRSAEPVKPRSDALTVGYAGSLAVGDYRRALKVAAETLRDLGGRLVIYGPVSAAQLQSCGLDLPNVTLRGSVPNTQVADTLSREVDALFLPMSFEAAQRVATTLCFPSKLADYTAARLPLLIRGPDYSSAVRWALENHGVAEVVSTPTGSELYAAFERMLDPGYRSRLAAQAFSLGKQMFERDAVRGQFHTALRRPMKADAP